MVERSEHVCLHSGRELFWLHTDVFLFTLRLVQSFLQIEEVFLHADDVCQQPLVVLLYLAQSNSLPVGFHFH